MAKQRQPTLRSALDWFFRDPRSGRRVIAQPPNLPILLFIASVVARWLVEDGTTLDTLLAWAGTVALAWWAVDELVRGQSPFRRLLGVGGIAAVVVMAAGRL